MYRRSKARRVAITLLTALGCLAVIQSAPSSAQIAGNAYMLSTTRWPSPSIPVCWETPGYNADKTLVRTAIERTWERESALDFTGWGECEPWMTMNDVTIPGAGMLGGMTVQMPSFRTDPHIRIQIADVNPHTKGLGRQLSAAPNGMVLNFEFAAWPCPYTHEQCVATIAVHEFGHAIGFAHEQNRPDTPAWCREPAQGTSGDTLIGAWDARSVMNYCHNDYNSFGALSAIDIQAVRQIYGAPATLPVGTAPPPFGSASGAEVSPSYGTAVLAPRFVPDPRLIALSAGGPVNASTLAAGCVGWVSRAPDYRVEWTTNANAGALIFSAASQSDTVLVIKDAQGNWRCDDDGGEGSFNPAIRIQAPPSGRYDVWVGIFASGSVVPAQLRISEVTSE